jgi:predicted DNA repair protein MutK
MMKREGFGSLAAFIRWFGKRILQAAPWLMKLLSVAGTAAMFLVGGSILVHGWPALQHLFSTVGLVSGGIPYIGLFLDAVVPTLLDGVFGVIAGAVCLAVVFAIQKLRGK